MDTTKHPGLRPLSEADPEIAGIVREEERYQARTVRLIASENYASRAVLEATGTVLTNKYSEGYPNKRYYEGQRQVDAGRVERAGAGLARNGYAPTDKV